jgi:hypothetical protein
VSEGGPGAGAIPPGTFRLDRDGVWRHEGIEVTHPGVLRNLYENLRAEGDRHYLQVGPARIPVELEDAPFVVVRLETAADGAVAGHLSDGTREAIDPETLVLDAAGVPYCRVKGGRFRARLSLPAWLQLAAHVESDPRAGGPVLALGPRRVPLRRGSGCAGPA